MQEVAQDLTLSSLHIRKQDKNTNLPVLEIDGKTKLNGILQGGAFYTQTESKEYNNFTAITTISKSDTLPPYTLVAGNAIHIFSQGKVTDNNGSDKLTITLKIGNTTIAASAALDVADNDIYIIDAWMQIRTIGISGTFVASGTIYTGAAGSTRLNFIKESTTIDTTQSQDITVNATYNNQSADNIIRSDMMIVTIH